MNTNRQITDRFLQAFDEVVKLNGLSQDILATEMGTSKSHISNLRKQPNPKPAPAYFSFLVSQYRVNPFWLLTGKGKMFI